MQQIDFGKGSIVSVMVRSSAPMLAAQLLNLLYSIVDRIYIGRLPDIGEAALGAVGICFPILLMITAFTNLFSAGGASLAAIAWGEGNSRKSETFMNTSFYLLTLSSLVLGAAGFVLAGPILEAFGAEPASEAMARGYLQIYLCGTFFSMIALGLNPYLNAQSRFWAGMLSILIGALCNLVLDPLFMFVFGWGINGAAIATVLSQFLSFVYVMSCMSGPKALWKLHKPRKAWFQLSVIRNITALGLASFVMQLSNSLVQIVSNAMLIRVGGTLFVTVMTIVNSVRQITDTAVFAIGDGCSPMLGYCYGAGEYDRLRRTILLMAEVLIGYTCLIWILILVFPHVLISLFNQDPVLMEAALPALKTYFFAYLFQAFQYTGQTVFKSLNFRKQAIFFSLLRKAFIVVPLIYILPHFWNPPVYGVFASEPVSNVIGGTACLLTMDFTVYRPLKTGQLKAAV